jgi:hypothetical protein
VVAWGLYRKSAQIGRWSAQIGSETDVVAWGLYRKSAQIDRWSANTIVCGCYRAVYRERNDVLASRVRLGSPVAVTDKRTKRRLIWIGFMGGSLSTRSRTAMAPTFSRRYPIRSPNRGEVPWLCASTVALCLAQACH